MKLRNCYLTYFQLLILHRFWDICEKKSRSLDGEFWNSIGAHLQNPNPPISSEGLKQLLVETWQPDSSLITRNWQKKTPYHWFHTVHKTRWKSSPFFSVSYSCGAQNHDLNNELFPECQTQLVAQISVVGPN